MQCFIVAAASLTNEADRLSLLAEKLDLAVSKTVNLSNLRVDPAFVHALGSIVVFVDPESDGALADEAIGFAQDESRRAFLIYVCEQIAPDVYKRLLRTGAGEWSNWQGVELELIGLVQRLAATELPERAAKVVSFIPAKGGVGNTTLALESAVCLATQLKRDGRRIAVLDLNLEGGTLADALDLEARFDLREVTERPERLDNQLIDIFVSGYSETLDVFASPLRRTSATLVDPKMIFSMLDLIAGRYDLIILDIPHQSQPWIDNLVMGSDAVLVVGTGTVPALKQLVATLAYLDALSIEPDKIGIAVNHCEVNLLGRISNLRQISGVLGNRRVFFIRRDTGALAEASNAGRPVTELSPGAGVTKDMRRVAHWIGHRAANRQNMEAAKGALP